MDSPETSFNSTDQYYYIRVYYIQVLGVLNLKKLLIIAGPSGAGKTTLCNYLTKEYGIPRVVTHTTRPKRPGEVDGRDYFFETPETFAKLHFFEHVKYDRNEYGSSHEALAKAWQKSDLASIVVETEGVASYLKEIPQQAYFIYLTVSRPELIAQRLRQRGDSEAEIAKRLGSSEFQRDLQLSPFLQKYAHRLVNDDWAETKLQIGLIVASLRK